jgi:mono/diheme cytochrome c family protein
MAPGPGNVRKRRVGYLVAAVSVGLLASGCGAVKHMQADDGNADDGKPLFVQHCGSCHIMADAETTGILGPNLDDVFGIVRKQGFDESTIRDVVRGQIAYPETETAEGGPGMPAEIVVGQEARDVADYVAVCAGVENCDAESSD